MERDFTDHKYKLISDIPKGDDYALGELFLISETDDVPKKARVRTIFGEKILYDDFVYKKNYGMYSLFKLVFTESNISLDRDLLFRAYKLSYTETDFPHVWILFEERETVKNLDKLEERHNYNLLGDAIIKDKVPRE